MRNIIYALIPMAILSASPAWCHGPQGWKQLVSLPNGTLIYYLWANANKAQYLLTTKSCDAVLSYLDQNAKKDNFLGSGIYASSNVFDASEHGDVLLEVHVPSMAKDLIPYPKPGNDNVIWYFTRELQHLEFHPFQGSGVTSSELQKMLFQVPWDDNYPPKPGHHAIANILWERTSDEIKAPWRNSSQALIFLPGYYQTKLRFKNQLEIRGFLLLQNLSYHKNVTAHFTFDGWKTTYTTPAFYSSTDASSGKELWSYGINLAIATSLPLQFYFSYENLENGEVYYESREGQNFTLQDFIAI